MARILLATDFSDNAVHAAEYAVGLFGPKGNTYTLFHLSLIHISEPTRPY